MAGVKQHPVAIGGVGGSGTRVGAALLQILGYYIGDDLNEPLDNLWFTLLFKRRSILIESEPEFERLAQLFFLRMAGPVNLSAEERKEVFALAARERPQHPEDWLQQRALSFSYAPSVRLADQPWGWKEPNTHIVIERLFQTCPDLRYIHINRHPINMSFSGNQAQLQNWGPIFLDTDVVVEPRLSLAYWRQAHRRIAWTAQRWPSRVEMIDFDALCAEPEKHFAAIVDFLSLAPPPHALERFKALVVRPPTASRHLGIDLAQFDPDDLAYVQEIGYPLG